MGFRTLISVADAAAHLAGAVVVDCTAVLGQPDAGRAAYQAEHLPGAVYADLDTDLSGPVIGGRTGRHPLPAEDTFAATASRLGISAGTQVIAYDANSGAMAAARLWWLLRWAGHDEVAVLDGGLAAWKAAGRPTETGAVEPNTRPFVPRFRPELVATADDVLTAGVLLDARAADRYRGENETVDPVAGHIPGARSRPFADNVTAAGTFRSPDDLRIRHADAPADQATVYCGSGVTAAHNALAYAHAGLGLPRLYAGSWSEWITDPARPVETGDPTRQADSPTSTQLST